MKLNFLLKVSQMDWATVIPLMIFVGTLVTSGFAYLWLRAEKNLDKLLSSHDDDISSLKRELGEHRLHVAESYVTQSELARTIQSLEKTVERLLDAINQMSRDSKEAFAELHRRIDGKADK